MASGWPVAATILATLRRDSSGARAQPIPGGERSDAVKPYNTTVRPLVRLTRRGGGGVRRAPVFRDGERLPAAGPRRFRPDPAGRLERPRQQLDVVDAVLEWEGVRRR